ncbi:MAG: CDP-2,3-bis-(O-geranylgeranyl)-sn-glycerol synthase [Candidatus Marsarchaeota archaeon]|nr:CDP-2,3-bis-(O-geranylgeranyl)-sn-glycerol synthase [Candidatus Marsarchaeota archaeon]MCL5117350.1 CDP-2,3-bis-(O-geranylgeranyl)-sn-glycerol synthase [Candidatus Marsarchaeota archaeon]
MISNFIYSIIIYPVIFILPAYVANGAPVIFGGGAPIDFNRKFMGKRVFGDHKTVRGTVSGILAGLAIGIVEYPFFHYMLPVSLFLVIGVTFGDLLGSFIKRRVNMHSGRSFPVLDQYGFLIFALLFSYPVARANFPTLYGILFLILLTGISHIMTNKGAHRLKLKEVPW